MSKPTAFPLDESRLPFEIPRDEPYREKIARLGQMITDRIPAKKGILTKDDPEYWGLASIVTDEMADVALKMKVRKPMTLPELVKATGKSAGELEPLLQQMAVVGLLEYNWENPRREKQYILPMFVPGSAEFFNMNKQQIADHPEVTAFFERMTFLPLEHITAMVPPGGAGIGMHVIPVEKAIETENRSADIEHISHWLKKYDGKYAAGPCSCRMSRAAMGEGCGDDPDDWCIGVGDMADYLVETNKGHYVTYGEVMQILQKAEDNGFVHQITNIDGENKIFAICNCNVNVCNALRTSQLFNTPNMSRSAYVARVEPENCVACGRCVEYCPAGAVKLGQKLCTKDGPITYPKQELPDAVKWGPDKWAIDYRDKNRINCYDTGTAPCKTACPAHIAVQGYLKMAAQGRYRDALALIKKENPFPAVCGRVCNRRCEDACTRGTVDQAVAIDAVKKFIAEQDLNAAHRYVPDVVQPSLQGPWPQKIAIIGGGPAGLSCAYFLAVQGYKPTVFEKNERPGGMLRYGIPSFKLEKNVIDAEIDILRELGVDIRCGVEVGKDVTLAELRRQGYRAFYIAIGCQGGRRPGVKNDDAPGTHIAVEYLRHCFEHREDTFDGSVVVIGGGNVAIDCARNAHRLGASEVSMFCLESRDEMPASREEVAEAEEENIKVNPSWGPKEVLVDESGKVTGIVLKKCVRTIDPETKRFSPVYDENETIEVKADKIVFAIGQAIEWGNLLEGTKVTFWHGNYPVADKFTYQTEDPDIFVGGDVYTGPRFVIDAIAAGHEAAESLHRHARPDASMTIGRDRRSFTPLNKDDIKFPSYDTAGRQEAGMDESIDAKMSFKDAHLDLTEEQVKIETGRCLGCGASYVDYNKCIGCGLCTTKCEFDAIHLVRDHPECSKMCVAEDKVGGLLKYSVKRAFKILGHLGSDEAKEMAKKRKAYKQAQQNKD